MTTEMITLKLEDKFLDEIDGIVEKEGYQNRTEFIRNALREKLDSSKLKNVMLEIAKFKGVSKNKTTDKEYEQIRSRAFIELASKFK